MKNYRNFFSKLKIYVTTPTSCTSKFQVMLQWSLTFSALSSMSFSQIRQVLRDCSSSFSLMIKFLLKCLFIIHYSFTILIFFKNCFNKFISSIFTSKNNYWLGKFIINTNKPVSKTTRNVILIHFWVRTFISTLSKLSSKSA